MRLLPKGHGRQACCQQTHVSLREGKSAGELEGRGTGEEEGSKGSGRAQREPGLQARVDCTRAPRRQGDRQRGGTGREPAPILEAGRHSHSPAREAGCGIQPTLLPADFQHHVDSFQSTGSVNCVTGTLTDLMLPFIHMCILNTVV